MGRTFDSELKRLLVAAGCRFVRTGKGSPANGVLKDAGLPKAFCDGGHRNSTSAPVPILCTAARILVL